MKKGFTLIELLVVVLIIGILSAIALPQYKKAVIKARFAEAMINLKAISQADDVCRMAGGGSCGDPKLCSMSDLDVQQMNTSKYFYYQASCSASRHPQAQYLEEDVCLCVVDGQIHMDQSGGAGCVGKEPSLDYAKLLNLPDDGCEDTCC